MSYEEPMCVEERGREEEMGREEESRRDEGSREEERRKEKESRRAEERGREEERGAVMLSCLDRDDGHADPLQHKTPGQSPATRYRRYGSGVGGVRVRHRRQALQDMARPLRHWLYKHRDNPYPTKTEKLLLALGSHMTLVQVSNWFANARRRLKNTVRQPDLSWALRIQLYNRCIQGNAERLSISSHDTHSDDECPLATPANQLELGRPADEGVTNQGSSVRGEGLRNDSAYSADDSISPPPKYKSSLLNRYLNDTLRHVMARADDVTQSSRRRKRAHSESFSSNEGDEELVSPSSSSGAEPSFLYHMDPVDFSSPRSDSDEQQGGGQRREEEDWREIHAAMALTNLAQGQSCTTGPITTKGQSCTTRLIATKGQSCTTGPIDTKGQSCTTGPITTKGQSCTTGPFATKGQSCTTGPITTKGQSCTTGPIATKGQSCTTGPIAIKGQSCTTGSIATKGQSGTTSCIIRKSSHISEVKTVKVALVSYSR